MPKWYSASIARQRLSDLLDAAEAGQPVVIERRGVRYTLAKATPGKPPRTRRRLVASADPAVAAGQWTWKWDESGLSFTSMRKR
jgi:antitoxin (DNA-binding transcriptional repressor) of toxin-antitoxin stability system